MLIIFTKIFLLMLILPYNNIIFIYVGIIDYILFAINVLILLIIGLIVRLELISGSGAKGPNRVKRAPPNRGKTSNSRAAQKTWKSMRFLDSPWGANSEAKLVSKPRENMHFPNRRIPDEKNMGIHDVLGAF